jgi:RNA polymerase sigma factor (sigma-70 family)
MRPADEVAWQEFVRRFHPIIRSNVVRTFHRKAKEDAERRAQFPEDQIEDLIQAVYLRLIEDRNKALARFEGEHENSIYHYLSIISVNVVRDHFREHRAQKRPKVSYSLDELIDHGGALPANDFYSAAGTARGASPDRSSVVEEIERALDKAVSGKNRDRDVLIFKLRYYEGLTLEEITTVLNLGISAISVGSILNRILKKLRPMLGYDK